MKQGNNSIKNNTVDMVFNELPNKFDKQTAAKLAIKLDMTPKTVEKYLTDLVKDGRIVRIKRGSYQKRKIVDSLPVGNFKKIERETPKSRYSDEFKIKSVITYLELGNLELAAKKMGTNVAQIHRAKEEYKMFNLSELKELIGDESSDKKRGIGKFMTETKIRAVKTYHKYGIQKAVEKFGAHQSSIYNWADQYRRGELGELVEIEPDEVVKETKQEINEKKDEMNYKREIVDTLNSLSLKVIELENRNAELEEENKLLKSMFLNSQISLEKTKQS